MTPFWTRKPKHKKEVIASDNGWIVKETGEILKSVKGLKEKLTKTAQTEPLSDVKETDVQTLTPELEDVAEASTVDESQGTEVETLEAPVSDEKEEADTTYTEVDKDTEKEVQDDLDTKKQETTKPKSRRGRPRKK